MADCMDFPSSWEQFLHDYTFEDSRRIYTNGSRLVPIFRVKQMVNHYFPAADVEPVRHGRWVKYAGKLICSECKKYPPMKDESGGWRTYHEWPYCPNCGTKMDEEVGT